LIKPNRIEDKNTLQLYQPTEFKNNYIKNNYLNKEIKKNNQWPDINYKISSLEFQNNNQNFLEIENVEKAFTYTDNILNNKNKIFLNKSLISNQKENKCNKSINYELLNHKSVNLNEFQTSNIENKNGNVNHIDEMENINFKLKKIQDKKNNDDLPKYNNRVITNNFKEISKFKKPDFKINEDNKSKFNQDDSNINKNSEIYSYIRYKEIPPNNNNFKMLNYFKNYISNNQIKKNLNKKTTTKINKINTTEIEINPKNDLKSENEENRILFENQNTLKNKLSYKISDFADSIKKNSNNEKLNFSQRLALSDIDSIKDIDSKTFEKSNIFDSKFNIINENIKIKQPIGTLRLENKFGEGIEDKFVDLNKVNEKLKYIDHKILNTKEIKEKIGEIGCIKDFEILKRTCGINSNKNFTEINDIFKREKKVKAISGIDNKIIHNSIERTIEMIDDKKNESKKNLIILKIVRDENKSNYYHFNFLI